MKIAKTYTFYTFLILLLATILMATVWFSKKTEEQRHVLQEQNAVFERYKAVLKLESNLIRKTVFDYSFWDELVEFVGTVDASWSKDNLDTIISTFDVDYVYVFDKQKQLVYAHHPHHENPLLPDIKALSTTQPQFKEFFQENKGIFNQFFVAPIHYSDDLERKGEPLGFFLLGREWDTHFHYAMEEISLGKATLSTSKKKSDFFLPLKDLNDSVLGYLSFEFTPSVLLFMTSLQNSVLISGLIVMITVICMFYLLTKDTFLLPIKLISSALKTHKPFTLFNLAQQKNELGEIALLILEYEKQKQLLEHYKEAIDENTIVSKTDSKGIITYINEQFIAISGYERDELLGKPHNIVRHPDNSPEFFHEMWKELRSGKTWKGIVKNRRKDGSAYYVKSVIMPLFDSHQRIKEYMAIRYDVSELFEQVERLRKETLSELPNRKMLLEKIDFSKVPHLAIVNISGFREINTIYGQSFGDLYLQSCASTIQNHLKNTTQLFHLQGDEFALFCDDEITQELFVEQCRTLLKTLSLTGISIDNIPYPLSLRFGIANGAEYLYNRAEIAIKEARTTHNSLVVYDDNEGFKQRLQQDIKWDQTIRDALAHNRFTLFLQEIVPLHVKKNARKKYELLIRLIDAKGAIISPFHFIDLAKRLHLYAHITHFVLQEGFRLAQELSCDISINITKEDMLTTETSALLFDLLSRHPELKKRVTLELVESESIEDSNDVRTFLHLAREKGCLIAIDDFGSGYSNFEYLLRLNVDFIKIDGSLIKNIDTDTNAYTTVKAITHFAKSLGISVVAEFVHSEEVLFKVKELGIDYAQGFHLHKPTDMTAAALHVKS